MSPVRPDHRPHRAPRSALAWLAALGPLVPCTGSQGGAPVVEAVVALPVVELPSGRCADAWRRAEGGWGVPPLALELASGPLALDDDAWRDARTWSGWGELLHGLRGGGTRAGERPSPAASHAALATLAVRQRRFDDAWRHLAEVDDPHELARLMPTFLPGVGAGEGDLHGRLPERVVLAPAPPPPSADARPGFFDARSAAVRGLVVGDATLDIVVALEPDGVQVELTHRAGGTARLALVLAAPDGFAIEIEYLDWERRETSGLPLEIELAPGETRTAYGRTLPSWLAWPGSPTADALPAALREGRLVLVGDEDPALGALAGAVGRLFDIECALVPRQAPAPALGVAVQLAEPNERRLAALASAVERLLLAPRGTDAPAPAGGEVEKQRSGH